MTTKVVEFTGSPKPFFKTKADFLTAIQDYGFTHGTMSKKDNKVDILVCDSPDSGTSKLKLAAELGVEVMTYEDMAELFGI
jgi:NAD-dependent DNA ligase